MSIDTVHADVKLTSVEPSNVAARHVCLTNGLPWLLPKQERIGLIRPKAVWIGDGALLHAVVGVLVDEGSGLHV